MTREVRLDCVAWDTAPLAPSVTLFVEDPAYPESPPATDTAEHDLIDKLVADASTRGLLLRLLGLRTPVFYACQVRRPFLESPLRPPGDIDLLLAAQAEPQHAIAIEVKRVKVRADGSGGQVINKLEAAARGLDQVKGLVSLGFFRSYLLLAAVVHDRSRSDSNFFFRGTGDTSLRRIIEFVEEPELGAAGILYAELSQPLGKPVWSTGMLCAGILREATPQEQQESLTAKVSSFLKEKGRVG